MMPALWLLTHPVPLAWLVPLAREQNVPAAMRLWPLLLSCLVPSLLAYRDWKWRRQVTFGWIALLFCSLQAYCFNSASHPITNPFVVWGFLPGTDGRHYLNGAVEIAEGIGIRSAFGARQMWPGFLALLHTWCHGDLKLMLSLLALMQAAIAVTTWELIRLMLGRVAAFIWLGCVALFYRSYVVGMFVTEQIGLPLGMLAAVTLLYAWRRQSMVFWLLGLLLLTCSLNARPGCYFVAALLVAATFWRFRHTAPAADGSRKFLGDLAWRRGMIAIAAVSFCIAANALSFRHLVNPPRMPSNFWLVWIGVFLSLPLAPPWDSGPRIYAATDPLIWLTPAAFCPWCAKRLSGRRSSRGRAELSIANDRQTECLELNASLRWNSTVGLLLVISSVLFPSVLLALNRNKTMPRYSDLMPLGTTSITVNEIPGSLIRRNRGIMVGPEKSRTFLPRLARDDFERGVPRGREFAIGEFMKELPDNSYIAVLGRPWYLICDRSAFQNEAAITRIPLQAADWMAYKYIFSLSSSVALTAKQVMILCPSSASHEIFWKPAVPLSGK